MNKKIAAILLVLFLFLSSCTPIETEPPTTDEPLKQEEINNSSANTPSTPSESGGEIPAARYLSSAHNKFQLWTDLNIVMLGSGHLIDLLTGEKFSLCFDPFCEEQQHLLDTCPQYVMSRGSHFIISEFESKENLVVYADSMRITGHGTEQLIGIEQFIRYDHATQTIEVLLEGMDLIGSTWHFDPYTYTIFYMAYTSGSESGISLFALDTKTKENRRLCDIPAQIHSLYINNDVLYFHGALPPASLYAVQLDEEESEMVEVCHLDDAFYSVGIYGEYYYYSVMDLDNQTTVPVPQEIVDRFPEAANVHFATRTFPCRDVYRIKYTDKQSVPELIIDNISTATITNGTMCYAAFNPQHKLSYLSNGKKVYRWDDPDAPANAQLLHEFTNYNGEYYILDVSTMEPYATIKLKDYDMEAVRWSVDGDTGVTYGYFTDYNFDRMAESGKTSPPTYFIMIPLTPGCTVTDEDVIIITEVDY